MPNDFPQRGEIYYVDLEPTFGSEQGGRRPALIIQNDISNRYSPVVIVASITSARSRVSYPTNVLLPLGAGGLAKRSTIQLNQLRTLDKRRLENYIGRLTAEQMDQVDEAIKISLGLIPL